MYYNVPLNQQLLCINNLLKFISLWFRENIFTSLLYISKHPLFLNIQIIFVFLTSISVSFNYFDILRMVQVIRILPFIRFVTTHISNMKNFYITFYFFPPVTCIWFILLNEVYLFDLAINILVFKLLIIFLNYKLLKYFNSIFV